jgi:putative transposase
MSAENARGAAYRRRMVLASRSLLRPSAGGRANRTPVVLHSDRGCQRQYTSDEYQRFLKGHQIRSSMSAVGTCADNAAAESFFGLLKRERVNRRRYRTRSEARTDIFDCIERFHNPRRARKIESLKKEEVGLTQPSVETG